MKITEMTISNLVFLVLSNTALAAGVISGGGAGLQPTQNPYSKDCQIIVDQNFFGPDNLYCGYRYQGDVTVSSKTTGGGFSSTQIFPNLKLVESPTDSACSSYPVKDLKAVLSLSLTGMGSSYKVNGISKNVDVLWVVAGFFDPSKDRTDGRSQVGLLSQKTDLTSKIIDTKLNGPDMQNMSVGIDVTCTDSTNP